LTNVLWASDFVDCKGQTDATTGWANMIASLNSNPTFGTSTIYVPSGCRITFKDPGTTNPAATVPANTHIFCDDESAGFAVDVQTCKGGTYPGAACNTSAECLGGGTCNDSFGNAATNPCSSTTCFAPAAGTFTLLKDQAGGNDIYLENCSFFLGQASPYQACTGGMNAGDPCRQECSNATTGGVAIGQRCETDADCNGVAGACLRVADCHTPGGTCGGLPSKVPSGPGSIRAIDFTRTSRPKLYNVNAFDALTSDFTVSLGPYATVYNSNFAREATDCTTPIPATPSNSVCLNANAGQCCYGAAANDTISSGNHTNTQPTTQVANQLITTTDAQLARVFARGTVAGSAISIGSRSHIEMANAWPFQTGNSGADHLGPGTPGGGFAIADYAQLLMSYALDLGPSGVCLVMSGAHSGNVGLKCNGASVLNGVLMQQTDQHTIGGNIRGLNAGGAIGVSLLAAASSVANTYIEGNSATGIGIDINALNDAATGNTVSSNPNDTFNIGIQVENGGNSAQIQNNTLSRTFTANVHITGAPSGTNINGNVSNQGLFMVTPTVVQFPTLAFHPSHVLNDGTANQTIIVGNNFGGGWHAYTSGARTDGLINTIFGANRIVDAVGAPVATGGAGLTVVDNYINESGALFGLGTWTSCDASCAGGSPVTRGVPCNNDSECIINGNTCGGLVFKCRPEPVNGYVGSPTAVEGGNHNIWANNIMFNGQATAFKQCIGSGPIGQRCDVAANNGSCNGGAVCSGTPAVCQAGGTETGKLCCTTGGTGACSPREPIDHLRIVDYGAAITHTLLTVANNTFFGGDATNGQVVDIDAFGANVGNISLLDFKITGNNFLAPGAPNSTNTPNTTAIRFPTAFTTIAAVDISDNSFHGFTTPATVGNIANYLGSFGSLSLLNGRIDTNTIQNLGTVTAITNFWPIEGFPNGTANTPPTTEINQDIVATGAMTVWKMSCQTSTAPSNTSSRVQTLMLASNPTSMTCSISGAATSCTSANQPVAVAANQTLAIKTVSTVVTALAASQNLTCTLYVSHDTAM
jgi:hypothetical protein